ncbi:MAG: hypothetical protein E5X33_27165 [Mesorhizobium sp.]|uniref:hypothetical protein n=1 Tax=Mesorhizobium sp. TaxID=1871066 RepID=UPI001222481F|nr:hypothetical protein [Mesorhizobium sp.]TIR17124.1 MAG: hypothetical protein E5X33_27165 [Mesorhizobium sp.]
MIRVCVTGHEAGDGMDWPWVRVSLRDVFVASDGKEAVTFLTKGTDQLFAEVALAHARGRQIIGQDPTSTVFRWDGSN